MAVNIIDLGLLDYAHAHQLQLQYVERQLQRDDEDEHILIVEHPPVFTLGKNGTLASLLMSREHISGHGIDIVHTERGGDITYHGPGQLVVYPIVNLRRRQLTVTDFVHLLEQLMIATAADFGVRACRDQRNRGIWVGDSKIGSVGIRVRHGVSFHGLALNVNLALAPFGWIRPCGLSGVGVTSLEQELGRSLPLDQAKKNMHHHISQVFCAEEETIR